jgi:hypothetical protein
MAFFKVVVSGKAYELDKLTLGDTRTLKRDFGLTDMENFSSSDPDQLVGLMFLAMSKERPNERPEKILRDIEAIDILDVIEGIEDEDEDTSETDPTPAAAEVADDGVPLTPATNSETTPLTPGDPSTPQN